MTERSPEKGPSPEEPPVERSGDLAYLWALCVDHRRLVLAITSLAAMAGLAYTALVTPVYRAEALLQIERADGGAFGGELFSMFLEDYQPATQQEILQSRMVLVRAAMQAGIGHEAHPAGWPVVGRALRRWGVERPGFLDGAASVWAGEGIAVETLGTARELEDVPLVLTVERGGGYSLAVKESRDTRRLRRELGLLENGGFLGRGREGEPLTRDEPFLNLLATEIDAPPGARFELTRRSEGGIAEDLLERFVVRERGLRTGVLELRLSGPDPEEIVRTLDTVTEVFLRQNISRRTAEASSRLEFLESYIPDVRRALADAEEALSRYQTSEESVNISQETLVILQNMVEIESQLNELAMEEDELAGRYTRNHPGYRVLLEQRGQLNSEKRRLEQRAGNLPDTQREVLRLNREVEVSQAIYTQMRNAMQELQIAQAGTIGNVRILDNALAERSPVFPNPGVIMGLSVVAGLAMSVITLLLAQILRRGIDNIDQIRAAGLEVVSTIPLSAAQGSLDRLRGDGEGRPLEALLRRLGALLFRRREWADGGAPDADQSVLALATSDEPAVEAIRSLRTSVYFIMKKAENNVLMVTGPTRGVGKSFVSSNLAAVYALTEKRVLLIDADLRKGRIHRTFRLDERGGLSEALAGRIPAAEAVKSSGQENLDVMPRGRHLGRPSEMLMSEAFSRILRDAGSRYDLVLVDTPPVTAVTDAVIVGRHAGASLLVTRYRVNTVKEIAHALRILKNEGVGIDGVVFNGVAKSAKDYYYYGYGYGYGYGDYDGARGRSRD